MKKEPARINDIQKPLESLGAVLQEMDTWEDQTPRADLTAFLKQTETFLTDCIGRIKTCKQHEEQLADNMQRLEHIKNILQFKAQDPQIFLEHALDQVILLTKSEIGYIFFYDEESRIFTLSTWSKGVMAECTIQNSQTIYQLEKQAPGVRRCASVNPL